MAPEFLKAIEDARNRTRDSKESELSTSTSPPPFLFSPLPFLSPFPCMTRELAVFGNLFDQLDTDKGGTLEVDGELLQVEGGGLVPCGT